MTAISRSLVARLAVVAASFGLLLPAAPASAEGRSHTVGAFFISYQPQDIAINAGDTMTFVNTDPASGVVGHSFTQATSGGAPPKFDSGVALFGSESEVAGISSLDPGKYLVQCRIHSVMKATLQVGPATTRPLLERIMEFLPHQ